jgi:hypothetical protein
MSAEGPMTEMILPLEGARPEMTPIWIPNEPILAKPQSEYVEMR